LRQIYEAVSPKNSFEWDWFVRATAATKGWEAVAKIYREYGDLFAESPSQWRARATVFLYVSDGDSYRRVTTNVIAAIQTTTNWQDQLAILHIVARGPFTFSPEQRNLCELLIQSVRNALPGVAPPEQARAHRAIGALQLRLAELTNGLAHLEQALQTEKGPANRGRTLLIKALCLQKLDRAEEAREAFAEGESVLRPLLFDQLSKLEGFLSDADKYDVLLRREAQELLGLK
jgi:tetratricopeptide (TPR) repeat protein